MNVGIMCGSRDTASMESRLNNSRAVSEIADMGYTFVMGAGETGSMRDVKEILRENGNMLITVGNSLELDRTTADVKVEVSSTFERAEKIYENSDVIIFLDGGTGTLSEFCSFLNNKIETDDKKKELVLVNFDGVYDKIIDDLVSGSDKTNYIRIVDRKKAIYKALDMAEDNDIVLIAGKGRDDYMAIDDKYLPYCDYDVIKSYYEQ